MQQREGAHGEVARVARDRQVRHDPEATGLEHLELHVKTERAGEHVEARAEVRRGGGDAHEPAPRACPGPGAHRSGCPITARSTAARSGSHGTTEAAWASAV